MASSYSVFSPLTPLEKRETGCLAQSNLECRLTRIAILVLAFVSILGGGLVLLLLPGSSLIAGLSPILLGIILLAILVSLCLFDKRPEVKPLPFPDDIIIEDLQNHLSLLLAQTQVKALVAQGFEKEVEVEKIIQDKERRLGEFDRELRCREVCLYRKLTEAGDRAENFAKLVELRELQSILADQFELLYRAYDDHISGILKPQDEDIEVSALQSKKDLLAQEYHNFCSKRNESVKKLRSLHNELTTVLQRLHEIGSSLVDSGKISLGDETKSEIDVLLLRQSRLIQCIAEVNTEILNLDVKEEKTRKDINRIVNKIREMKTLPTSGYLFFREYKERYLLLLEKLKTLKIDIEKKSQQLCLSEGMLEDARKEQAKMRSRFINLEQQFQAEFSNFCHRLKEKSKKALSLEEALETVCFDLIKLREDLDLKNLEIEKLEAIEKECKASKQENTVLRNKVALLTQTEGVLKQKIAELEEALEALRLEISEREGGEEVEAIQAYVEISVVELQNIRRSLQEVEADLLASTEISAALERQVQEQKLELCRLNDELKEKTQRVQILEREVADYEKIIAEDHPLLEERGRLRLAVDNLEERNRTLERDVAAQNLLVEAAQAALVVEEKERRRHEEELTVLRRSYATARQEWRREKTRLEQQLALRREEYESRYLRWQAEVLRLEVALRETRDSVSREDGGGLVCLAQQLIRFSPHIKSEKREDILKLGIENVLAFTAPRFFYATGRSISCSWLHPGENIEAGLTPESTEAQRRAVVEQRCFREWLLALLGTMTIDEIRILVAEMRQEVGGRVEGTFDARKIFDSFCQKNPRLVRANILMRQWIIDNYTDISQLLLFTDLNRWNAFLLSSLLKMHFGVGGCLEGLTPEERKFLDVMSCFSGKIPLILGSLGPSGDEACPLGLLDFVHCGNDDWNGLIAIVENLIKERSRTAFPRALSPEDIGNARVSGVETHIALSRIRFPRATRHFPTYL